ncbi:MAG: hypothetical protein AAF526_08375 [Pseudomonadota bacterium]
MNDRTTSAAKAVLTPDERSLLESYGVVTSHFEHARDQLISKQHYDLAKEQQNDRAREERGSILANGGERLPDFREHTAGGGYQDRDETGSKMVKEDQPNPQLKPSPEFAAAVDRQAFDQKWFEEQGRAARIEQAQDKDQNRDNDREPEPGR